MRVGQPGVHAPAMPIEQLAIEPEPVAKTSLYPKAAWEISSNPMWAPAAREGHSAVYSPSLNQLILFGGYAAGQGHLSDCSVCKLEVGKGTASQVKWSRMRLGGGISKRSHHGCALLEHPERPQMIIFGGESVLNGKTVELNDAWSISIRTGEGRALIGNEGVPPTPRRCHSLTVASSDDGRMLVIGGCGQNSSFFPAEDNLHLLHVGPDGADWRSGAKVLKLLAEEAHEPAPTASPREPSSAGAGRSPPRPASAQHARSAKPPSKEESKGEAPKEGKEVSAAKAVEAARVAAEAAERRVTARREAYTLLERRSHSASVAGKVVLLFGGKTAAGDLARLEHCARHAHRMSTMRTACASHAHRMRTACAPHAPPRR